MTRQSKALAYGLVTVLLWSTVASAFKLSLQYLQPLELLLWANIFSLITLGLILLVQGKIANLAGMAFKDVLRQGALGILNPFLYYVLLFKAYELLPAQQAQPLNYTWAITLSLLSVPILGHRLSARELGAIMLGYTGAAVIATRGNLLSLEFSNELGVTLALASTLIWAVYWLLNTRNNNDPVITLFLNFLFALPLIWLTNLWLTGLIWPSLPGLAGAAYVGVFEMGVAFVLWLHAMKLTESTARLAGLIYLSPFLSLVLIHYLVGEEIHWSSGVGLVLIVTGTLLQQFLHVKKST